MATPTIQTDVFKFVALRAPDTINKEAEETNFIKDSRQPEETPVGAMVAALTEEDADKIPDKISSMVKESNYDLQYPFHAGNSEVRRLLEGIRSFRKDDSLDLLNEFIQKIVGEDLSRFLEENEIMRLLSEIWDRYYAFYLLNRTIPQNLEELTMGLRIFHLLEHIDSTGPLESREELETVMTATPVIPKLFTDLPKPAAKKEEVNEVKVSEETARRYKDMWKDFLYTHQAMEDLKALELESKVSSETKDYSTPDKSQGREKKAKITILKNDLIVSKAAFNAMRPQSKQVLSDLNYSEKNLQVPTALNRLSQKLGEMNSNLLSIKDPLLMEFIPKEVMELPGIRTIFPIDIYTGVTPAIPYTPPTNARALIKPLGIGDLKVVKQKLKKYVTGEVAHIENVLKGEYKDRKHRVLDRTEDILVVSTETQEETSKDTQTTERFELKKETEKTIQEQMSIQAGVTVSGSYGVVSFGAHADFAYSTSSTESSKNSSNYAREVIDKSVSKIQKNTRQERTTKQLHEVEEINTHGLDNKIGTGHITGIYRWVDKHYEAQIFNYGKRMMFEFIIPEPSSFFEYAQLNRPKKLIKEPKELNALLTHKGIHDWNYQDYIRDYNVQGVTTPPPYNKICTVTMEAGDIENGKSSAKSIKELVVPDGYVAKYVGLGMSVIWENHPQFKIAVGDKVIDWLNSTDARRGAVWSNDFVRNYDSIIPVSIVSYDVNAYQVNVNIICDRTPEKYEQWQISTFEKITNAYKLARADYEQRVNAAEQESGIAIRGQNPGINREIEKVELKKHCIKMLMDTYLYGSFNATIPGAGGAAPEFDIFDAIEEGKIIQFFEQGFEWQNLTYLYYPYFWARKTEWLRKSSTFDNDPLFSKFLQAGAARVVIPVHPAYNDAIMYYLETGAIWNGGDAPRLNDPLFISIHEELRNQTDDLANATPEGDPWEVVLPTTLVYLQQDAVLPTF